MGDFDLASMLRQKADEQHTMMSTDLASIFSEEPVSLPCFVQDSKFLGNPPLSPVQYEAVRHIERIYLPALYPQMAELDGKKRMGTLHVGPVSSWRDEPYWSVPYRMTNFITLQWGKGCKVGSMPIYDARTGDWTPISEWRGGHVAGADEEGKIRTHEASEAWISGRGECFRVTTAGGLVDEVYAGHRYLVRGSINQRDGRQFRRYYSQWQQLRDLKVGDYIAAANAVPEPAECVPLDSKVVELLALLLGDGCLPNTAKKRYSVALTVGTKDTVVTARFTDIVRALGGTVSARSDGRRVNLYAVGPGTRGANPIINLLRRYGMDGPEAQSKRIPDEIFRLPNEQVALFLGRLIDTDGHIYVSDKGRVPEVGYTTASHVLAVGVQRLLLRLGCKAQIQHKRVMYDGAVRIYYCVRMRDRTNVREFCRQITTLSKEPARLRALDACAEGNGKTHARLGDLAWDKIVSIEPLGEQDYWDLEVPGVHNYVSNGTLNHNSGKDHVARVACMRIAYLLLCLESPQAYYGMPEQDTIHLLNVASNSHQARDAFFTPMTKAVRSGWFRHRADPKQNVIDYDKNIVSISGHSDAESQEGLNLLLAVADEIDAFRSRKEVLARRAGSGREPTKSAEGILNMMRSSGITRFPKVFKNVRISFPRYLGSTIQQLTTEGKKDIKSHGNLSRHFVSGPLATWQVNPRHAGPEDFAQEYTDDPVMAKAKYECQPARAVNPYFRNVMAVDSAFQPRAQDPIEVTYRVEDTDTDRAVWIPSYVFAEDLFPVRGAIYAMHGDLAVTGDRAGIAMAHVASYSEHDTIAEDEDGATHVVREVRPHVKVDFVISFTSDSAAEPPREIQIRWARQLCFELIRRGFNIKRFSFDVFQSTDSMQILKSKGIECERVSTDMSEDPYRSLRDLMYEGRLTVPRPPVPADKSFLLRDELLSLTRMPNGRIDHPIDGSKDESDALACACFGAVLIGGHEEESGARASYSAPEFTVSHAFELPIGVNPRKLWEREFPSIF